MNKAKLIRAVAGAVATFLCLWFGLPEVTVPSSPPPPPAAICPPCDCVCAP